jgi:16S rRNA (cytosine967-C5)-methyltransferase
MHITSQLKAVLELLETVLNEQNKKPADDIFVEYCRGRRYIGSKDRQFIAQYFFDILRYFNGIQKALADQFTLINAILLYWFFKNESFKGLHEEHQYGLVLPKENVLRYLEAANAVLKENLCTVPQWTEKYFKQLGPNYKLHIEALHKEASFDIRINPLLTTRDEVLKILKSEGIGACKTKLSFVGLRLEERVALQGLDIWKKGFIEIQDEGAQVVSVLCDAQPGDSVLDYCAGAGGKTLLLSSLMANKGKIVATDLHSWRLDHAKKRLKRAQAFNVQIKPLDEKKWWKRHEGTFDRVLIDVPCSGSGTWRRNPDMKRRFTQTDLDELVIVQQNILNIAKKYVQPKGFLIYATCSLWGVENQQQIAQFLTENIDFSLVDIQAIFEKNNINLQKKSDNTNDCMVQLTPYEHGVDGFFVAIMTRKKI